MLSKINYFKGPEEEEGSSKKRRHTNSTTSSGEIPTSSTIDKAEPDSTSVSCATSQNLPDSVKSFTSKKGSLSETDLFKLDGGSKKGKRRSKKLKLDINKANQSMSEGIDKTSENSTGNVENTPTHLSLNCKSSEAFYERLRDFELNQSFDIFDAMSEGRPETPEEMENLEIESLSEHSDSDTSISNVEDKTDIKMCRKVEPVDGASFEENRLVRSTTPESFGDFEMDRNEEERRTLLLSYQMKLEKMESFLKQLLTEFQFHIEVSKIFHCKSVVSTLPGSDVSNLPKILGEITHIETLERNESPGSWNIVIEKEDTLTKFKLKKQLLSLKHHIDEFVNAYLVHDTRESCEEQTEDDSVTKTQKFPRCNQKNIKLHSNKTKRDTPKRLRVNNKKKHRRYNDYPDLKEVLHNLFALDTEQDGHRRSDNNITDSLESTPGRDFSKCTCQCRQHQTSSPISSQTDSGLITKTGDDRSGSESITSSIGNFTLDTSTLTAYSESLDQIISYSSFQDTSLYSTMLQKAAIERITFYVQVHSIQLKCEVNEGDFESKNVITFYCPACLSSETDEQELLKHILSQKHGEKIHFLYKTAYIKKCFASGKEIQPSTVLNPMTMYRDENKIVCFGDAMYACSLCFENLIVGESVLMAHCAETEHSERKDKLVEVLE